MKKILIVLIINLLCCNISFAEWVMATQTKTDYYYYDNESIKKDNNYTYVWVLDDMTVPEPNSKSMKLYMKINCKLLQFDYMQIIKYTGQLGKGSPTLYNYPKVEWTAAPPGSAFDLIFRQVCSK
jgi:hypothetical protein